ncbi:MAG: hypothetical protein ACYCX4_00550 [Bacillota bacterium]
MKNRANVQWILFCSVTDQNWKEALSRLTEEELQYCLQNERRTTSLNRLKAEQRRRKKAS